MLLERGLFFNAVSEKERVYYYDSDSNGENGSEKENWVHNLDLLSRSDESDEEIFVSKQDLTPNSFKKLKFFQIFFG